MEQQQKPQAKQPVIIYYKRKCISCLNKVVIPVTLPSSLTETSCPYCQSIVRIWP